MKKMRNLVAILIVLVGTFTLNAQTNDDKPELNGGTNITILGDNTDSLIYTDLNFNDYSDNEIFVDLNTQEENADGDSLKCFKLIGEKNTDSTMTISTYFNEGSEQDIFTINTESRTSGGGAGYGYNYHNEFYIENDNKYNVNFLDTKNDTLNIKIEFDDYTSVTVQLVFKGLEDTDNDGVADIYDNCPETPNADQADEDNDGIGDVCDSDTPSAINTFSTSDNTISVYPNPVTNFLNVSGEFERVNVYDVSGKQLISTNDSRIDVSKLENGIYIVKVDGVSIKISKN